MTSNIGSEEIAEAQAIGFEKKKKEARRTISREELRSKINERLKDYFKPEFLNRLDETIIFNYLSEKDIEKIVDLQLRDLQKRLEGKRMHINLTESAKRYLAKTGFNPKFGARPLKRTIQNFILNPLAQKIIEGVVREGERLKIDEEGGKIVITPFPKRIKKIELLSQSSK